MAVSRWSWLVGLFVLHISIIVVVVVVSPSSLHDRFANSVTFPFSLYIQTAKDATMLGWAMEMGASQAAIAEHAKPSLSDEQQTVLTQALINVNSTTIRGVTISTVLLR